MANVGELAAALTLNASQFNSTLGSTTSNIRNFDSALNTSGTKAKGFFDILGGFGTPLGKLGIGMLAAGTAVVGFGKAALSQASEIQQFETKLGSMIGSMEQARQILDELTTNKNLSSAFDQNVIMDVATSLTAMNVAGQDLLPTMLAVGDLSRGSSSAFSEMADAIGKMTDRGEVSSRVLMAFANNQVPLVQALADKFGIAQESVMDFAEKGAISVEDVTSALQQMTSKGGRFFGQLANNAETASGKMQNLSNVFQDRLQVIGEQALPALVSVFDTIITFLESIDVSKLGQLLSFVIQLGQALIELAAMALSPVVSLLQSLGVISVSAGAQVGITTKKIDAQSGAIRNTGTTQNRVKNAMIRDEQKFQEAVGKSNKEIEKENEAFNKQLAELIDTREASVKDLMSQMGDERNAFAKSEAMKLKEYQQNLEDMAESHAEKIDGIKDQMQDEKDNFAKFEEEKNDQLKESVDKENEMYQDKVDAIEKALSEAAGLQNRNSKEYMEKLKRDLEAEKQAHNLKVADLKAKNDKEVSDRRAALDKKLADAQEKIDKEEAAYQKQLDRVKTRFAEETAANKEEYDKRTTDLQTKLDTDLEFLKKHAEDAKQINRELLLDEIDELKKSHADRLQDLQENLQKQQSAFDDYQNHITGGIGAIGGANSNMLKDVDTKMGDLTKKKFGPPTFIDDFHEGCRIIGQFFVDLWSKISSGFLSVVNFFKDSWNNIASIGREAMKLVGIDWDSFAGNITGIIGTIADVAGNVFDGTIGAVKGALNGILTLLNKVIQFINDNLINNLNKIPGVSLGHIGSIPYLASGAQQFQGMAVVGENGPELVNFGQPVDIYSNPKSQNMLDRLNESFNGGKGGSSNVSNVNENKNIYINNKFDKNVDPRVVMARLNFQVNRL